jgi:hypothetical protein
LKEFSMIGLKNLWCLALLWLASACLSNAVAPQAHADPTCPEGFQRSPSGAVCFAKNLAGPDGSGSGLTASIGTDGACPPRFERPPGVNFCVLDTLTVNAADDLLILEAQTSRFCPEGFHRPAGRKLCIASNLTVQGSGSTAALRGPTQDCPIGFYRPVGSTICVAGNETARTLPVPDGPACPQGFHRPPGVAICIAKNLVFGTAVLNLPPPVGVCPKNWHRPPGLRFCIPKYIKAPSTAGFNPVLSDTIVLACPAGTVESWFDVPVYDEATGLFVVDYVTTRFCIPENLPPAG